MEVSEVIELETVEIEPIDSLDVRVYVVAICDTGDGIDRLETAINYTPSEWPANEQFEDTTGKPTESQLQWLQALGDWKPVTNEDI